METEVSTKEHEKISKTDFFWMLVVAIFFDICFSLIQLIPVVGSVFAMVFNVAPLMGFFIWYKIKGIDFSNPKRSISFFGASIIEFIPILNILPTWTAEIIYMYVLQKKDILLAKAAGVVGGVAGGAAVASKVAGSTGAKDLSENLKNTSERLRQKSESLRNSITPQPNMVGNEINQGQKNK